MKSYLNSQLRNKGILKLLIKNSNIYIVEYNKSGILKKIVTLYSY